MTPSGTKSFLLKWKILPSLFIGKPHQAIVVSITETVEMQTLKGAIVRVALILSKYSIRNKLIFFIGLIIAQSKKICLC